MYRILGRKRRNRVREIAREEYLSKDPESALASTRERVRAEYGSLIGTILVALAVKLATALIMSWIEDNLLEPPGSYQSTEPGFSSET